jgi:hypothetical protein
MECSEVFRREEYKAALAPVMGTGFDPAHRDNVTLLLKVQMYMLCVYAYSCVELGDKVL